MTNISTPAGSQHGGREAPISVEVQAGDALTIDSDVLVLKYAQALHGVDRAVAKALGVVSELAGHLPPNGSQFFASNDKIVAKAVLFVGVNPLHLFGYEQIREFARNALQSLAGETPQAQHVALTLHGPGYGLDEAECFIAEIAGIVEAIESGDYPDRLTTVTFVEENRGRASRLVDLLDAQLPGRVIDTNTQAFRQRLGVDRSQALRSAGSGSAAKPYVFVAMAINDETDDLYYYGISTAIRRCGFLSERIDQSPATGDIVASIRQKIDGAAFVVADLTNYLPNVFLEVGYAWGRGRPTILLVKNDALKDLPFDVKTQRCLTYGKIQDAEKKLAAELETLSSDS